MNFSLLILWAGKTRYSVFLYKGKIPARVRSRLERNLESRKDNLITKNARSGLKRFVSGI